MSDFPANILNAMERLIAEKNEALADLHAAKARIVALEQAIQTVLADDESQHPGGWGPDVTTVGVLRRALKG